MELLSPVQVSDFRHVQYSLLPSDLMYLTLQYHEYTITITSQYQTYIRGRFIIFSSEKVWTNPDFATPPPFWLFLDCKV